MKTNRVTLNPFDAFRPGTFVANDGRKMTISDAVINELIETYDPAVFSAPIVVGHPKTDSPAFGHVHALGKTGEKLQVTKSEVTPEFATAAIADKRYNKISIKMFLPDSPANPKPGKHYLQHVGFLGGMPPAVPGLEPVALAANDELSFEFSADFSYEDRLVARMFRSLREYLIGKDGQETADRVLSDWDITALAESAAQENEPGTSSVFATPSINSPETTMTAQTAADAAALKQREDAITARETALAEREKAAEMSALTAEFSALTDKLIGEGRLLPVQKMAVTEILTALSAHKEPSAAFAAGDENHGKTPLQLAQGLLEALPVQVPLDELKKPKAGQADAAFSAPAGFSVDSESLEIHAKAIAHQAAHPGVSYIEAVQAVNKGV